MNPDTQDLDASTTIGELRQMVRQFVEERDWQRFHAPKNISMALAIEASELMEHFQWVSVEESRQLSNQGGPTKDPEKLAAIGEELADVVCYALAMANELDIDLTSTMREKMVKNVAKYPAEKFQGRYE